jgi:hypothetical protein
VTQGGFRSATVRLLVGLAVVAFVGAGALLAIGPNRTADWKASDCGAPIRWLTGDGQERGIVGWPPTGSIIAEPAPPTCSSLVWRQIHWAAGLGATGLGFVAVSIVAARTRRRRGAVVPLIAV